MADPAPVTHHRDATAPDPDAAAPTTGDAAAATAPHPVGASDHAQAPAKDDHGTSILAWLSIAIAGALAFQLLVLGLRPLRRALTLRHLRRPFWDETVDQRISNWWQLVLIGLRDAGWHATSTEQPREFARRVNIDGVDRCAAILDRARHGIRLDHDDVAGMGDAAETAYQSAREDLGTGAKVAAQLRWPLT